MFSFPSLTPIGEGRHVLGVENMRQAYLGGEQVLLELQLLVYKTRMDFDVSVSCTVWSVTREALLPLVFRLPSLPYFQLPPSPSFFLPPSLLPPSLTFPHHFPTAFFLSFSSFL